MSVALEKRKVIKAVETKLDGYLKKKAMDFMSRKLPLRQSSKAYAASHPKSAVDDRQKIFAAELRQRRLSFREIEGVLHLAANNGMAAYRCVQEGKKLSKQKNK